MKSFGVAGGVAAAVCMLFSLEAGTTQAKTNPPKPAVKTGAKPAVKPAGGGAGGHPGGVGGGHPGGGGAGGHPGGSGGGAAGAGHGPGGRTFGGSGGGSGGAGAHGPAGHGPAGHGPSGHGPSGGGGRGPAGHDGRGGPGGRGHGAHFHSSRDAHGHMFGYHGHRYAPWRAGRYHWPHGYGYVHYDIGVDIPVVFWSDESFVIVDYADYDLAAPDDGFEWIRVGNDALLINTSNGAVADAAYGAFEEQDGAPDPTQDQGGDDQNGDQPQDQQPQDQPQ